MDFSVDYPQAQATSMLDFIKRWNAHRLLKADEWRSTTYKTRGVIDLISPQTVIFDRLSKWEFTIHVSRSLVAGIITLLAVRPCCWRTVGRYP